MQHIIKNSVLPLAIFYRNHGYKTFVLLDNTEESKQISAQLESNQFSAIQTIFFEREGKKIGINRRLCSN